jgi:Flp pilus assembly protein protease CpaA
LYWLLCGLMVGWLLIISWFDLRKGEIPHSGWVIIPLVSAIIYRAILGDFSLVALTILVVFASEREKMVKLCNIEGLHSIKVFLPGLLLTLYWANEQNLIGALAILGFWIAWELSWWGGADAITAITLCLIWPTMNYVLAFLLINTLAVALLSVVSLFQKEKVKLHRIPGLPLLLLSVICLQFIIL